MRSDSVAEAMATKDEDSTCPPSNEIQINNSTATSLRLVDNCLQAFTINSSILSNVLFRDCAFSNVTFTNCSFKDVAFSGLEWSNVRISGVVLRAVAWDGTGLKNVCITDDMRLRRSHGIINIPIRDGNTTTLSRSMVFTPGRKRDQTQRAAHHASVAVVSDKSAMFLKLPKAVLHQIIDHVFPDGEITISDRDITPYPNTRQTQYCLGYDRKRFYTYQGRSRSQDDQKLALPLLRTHSRLHRLAISHIHDRRFTLVSPEGCLAFLHDHQKSEHRNIRLSLRYGSNTSLAAWRRLFDILVWERPEISELSLVLDQAFWTVTPWEQGVESMMRWISEQQSRVVGKDMSFLECVASVPGARLLRAGEVRFFLKIDGSDLDRKRAEFVKGLETALRSRMLLHPDMANGIATGCHCAVRVLEHCCYWRHSSGDP
ncbi:hypothetical protein TI39_contig415g00018 [Zymoseptoria brevis]|uniref:Uncharacterized protein n=1 Tax=Zymoseptoria brevis TaxID=1047168 RepID=A0A0F4GQ98_9PEZI|nr:hypothetical protein TI39_contig415g00018 [Zymoseptoria brevis]